MRSVLAILGILACWSCKTAEPVHPMARGGLKPEQSISAWIQQAKADRPTVLAATLSGTAAPMRTPSPEIQLSRRVAFHVRRPDGSWTSQMWPTGTIKLPKPVREMRVYLGLSVSPLQFDPPLIQPLVYWPFPWPSVVADPPKPGIPATAWSYRLGIMSFSGIGSSGEISFTTIPPMDPSLEGATYYMQAVIVFEDGEVVLSRYVRVVLGEDDLG